MKTPLWNERPEELVGLTTSVEAPNGHTVYITLNYLNSQPVEVFVRVGKSGADERADAEALGRALSIALQFGTPLGALIHALKGISSETTRGFGPNKVLSTPDAIGRGLEQLAQLTPAEEVT